MADNVDITPGTGKTIAADDVGGILHQRVKVVFGPDGTVNDVAPDKGMPIVGGYTELTGSASANNADLIASTDVRGFRTFSIQLSGSFVATVYVQQSNDATTWTNVPTWSASPNGNSYFSAYGAGLSSAQLAAGILIGRYMRVRILAYTSGTPTAVMELSQDTTHPPPYQVTDQATGYSMVKYDPTVGFNPGDALSNTSAELGRFGALNRLYNVGGAWDRVRAADAVHGTTGIGLLGAGQMGYDGTNWKRVRSSVATASQSSVAANASSVSLLAANSSREMATFYNDSASAYCYLKLGATASATSFTYKMPPGGYYELPKPTWAGAIDGIWDAAVGNMRITELT
jgi:hypothetical protein